MIAGVSAGGLSQCPSPDLQPYPVSMAIVRSIPKQYTNISRIKRKFA